MILNIKKEKLPFHFLISILLAEQTPNALETVEFICFCNLIIPPDYQVTNLL